MAMLKISTAAALRRFCESSSDELLHAAVEAALRMNDSDSPVVCVLYARLDRRWPSMEAKETFERCLSMATDFRPFSVSAPAARASAPAATTTETAYNPNSQPARVDLALALRKMLHEAGFEPDQYASSASNTNRSGELIYSRRVVFSDGTELQYTDVLVYTTIQGNEVRSKDADAIRVCTVYRPPQGRGRGLTKDARVFRTGTIEGVVERTKERMRNAWSAAKQLERCRHCGAPTFVSKANKRVCAAICWEKKAS